MTEAVGALRTELEALAAEEAQPAPEPEEVAEDDTLIAEAEAAAARAPEVGEAEAAASEAPAADVPEGARLLALKMALDGRPRDETAAYLRENFELDDPEALLDEVYARVGG